MNKRKFLRFGVITLLCGAFSTSQAQPGLNSPTNPIRAGSLSINAGAGLGVPYNGSLGAPFGVKAAVDWGIVGLGSGAITLGLSAGGSFSHGSRDAVTVSTSRVFIQARAAWHYGWEVPGLDVYGGLSSGVGLDRFHYGDPLDKTTRSAHLLAGVFIGASYFLTPGFGFNAEAGDDITIAQLGIIIKPQ